ncbi:adhesion G-protein coupled receptor G7-like isoform X2 [Mugil cephalus]|uniref:adhesion G-protein coupled receptor G7-like isoform X2 n=1 Tax=Mugil cephalus TaxID=48193 RepID=UPI001FB6CA8F|nr:adhesion G-protein coupled receptor G7-like isoform X2 [Mugil cephalus]
METLINMDPQLRLLFTLVGLLSTTNIVTTTTTAAAPETPDPAGPTTPIIIPETPDPAGPTTPIIIPETPDPAGPTTPIIIPETPDPVGPTTPIIIPETPDPAGPTTPIIIPETPDPVGPTTPIIIPETPDPVGPTTLEPTSTTIITPGLPTTTAPTTPPPNTTPTTTKNTTTATTFPTTTTTPTTTTPTPNTPTINFCQANTIGDFTFPQTPIGWFAYSEEVCPPHTSAAGKPRASVRCVSINGFLAFQDLKELECEQTLSDIQQNLDGAADLETLASSTQILTSTPENLTAEEVTTAVQITNTLLLSPNASESVRVAAVATVSQLLNASLPDDPEAQDSALQLTETLDELSVNLNSSQVVQPNLVVQSTQVPTEDTQGVQFTVLTGTSGSFESDRIKLNTNASEEEESSDSDVLIYIRFSAEKPVRQNPSNVSLGFVLYQNDLFFQSNLYRKSQATIRVLSGRIKGQEGDVVPQRVDMMFRPKLINGTTLHDYSCVFWDYTLKDWSTVGCWKGSSSDGLMRCSCNHTTNFAALWSFKEDYQYAEALDVISIVGLSFSILGLVVTIIHHLTESFYRKSGDRQINLNSKLALLSICVCLLAFIITFLSGVNNWPRDAKDKPNEIPDLDNCTGLDSCVDPDQGPCTAVTALLHFFLLATFTWTSFYGTQLMLLVRTLARSLPSHWTSLSLVVGFGVPAVVMAVTLGVTYSMENPLGYRQEEFCWLAALDEDKHFDVSKPMFWGFVLPVGLILVYNTVLLVLVSMTTCRTDPKLTSTRRWSLWKKFLVCFSLVVMLGLSWSLGFMVLFTTGKTHFIFSILFCLCTTTQGFQVFILFTARTKSFRAVMHSSLHRVSNATNNLWTSLRSTSSEVDTDSKEKDFSGM